MKSHFVRSILPLGALLAATACGAGRPEVKLLGASPATADSAHRVLRVFVEVINPTGRDIELSGMDYTLRAERWFDAAGHIALRRSVTARTSAVVEITVPLTGAPDEVAGVPYRLEGTLFGHSEHVERSWRIRASGALASASEGEAARVSGR